MTARTKFNRARLRGVALLALAAAASPALADTVESLAQRLSSLRGEVETLSSELATLTADQRDELRSLSRQKVNLELELKKEETRVQKLRFAVSEKRDAIAETKNQDAELEPLFHRHLAAIRQFVETSLPFRRPDRLAALEKLENQLRTGLLSPPRAVSRLWTFVEDEFRLTRENGLYQQTIELEGQEQLADVLRIGSVMLLFKTNDDSVGYAEREEGAYVYRLVTDPASKKRLLSLFDSFRKQIRVGYFQLPNTLADDTVVAQSEGEAPAAPPRAAETQEGAE